MSALPHISRSNIASILLAKVFIISVILLVTVSIIQFCAEYIHKMSEVMQNLDAITLRHEKGISEALWTPDRLQLQAQLEGIVHIPYIVYAGIYQKGEAFIEAGNIATEGFIDKETPIIYQYNGKDLVIGSFYLQASKYNVMVDIFLNSLKMSLIYGVMILVVAFFIFQIFTNMVSKPLALAAAYFNKSSLQDLGQPLVLKKKRNGDEIDILVDSFNHLRIDLQKAYKKLSESEEQYRILFDQSLDAIAVHAGDPPVIKWVNPAFSTLFGYSPEEAYSLKSEEMWKLVHPEDLDNVRNSLLQRLSGQIKEVRYAFRIVRKDGDIRWIETSSRGMTLGGQKMNMSIYRDITKDKQSAEILKQAKDAAETASKVKSEFLANMSHEIRTPLNGILGMLQLIRIRAQSEEQQEYIAAAITSVNRLTKLLADILDISKIEAGKIEIVEVEFEPNNLKASIQELFMHSAKEKGVELSFIIDEKIPRVLIGDESRLRQILFNLVGNAIKFTDEGFVHIEMNMLPSYLDSGARILFTVSDSGIGISDEHLKNIFEPFEQAEGAYTRRFQGAGLGLSIVWRLVQIMDGGLSIDSRPDQGTNFYVSLPFKISDSHGKLQEPPSEPSSTGDDRFRVLFVEDDEISKLAGKKMLEDFGYIVTTADNGKEVLQLLAEHQFDIILMDVQLPVMDGVEATRKIRASNASQSHIPIIATTAYAMIGDKEKFLAAGMNDYIAKPFDYDELKGVLERVMHSTRSATV